MFVSGIFGLLLLLLFIIYWNQNIKKACSFHSTNLGGPSGFYTLTCNFTGSPVIFKIMLSKVTRRSRPSALHLAFTCASEMHKHNAIRQSAQHLFFRCRLWLKADRWRLSLFISQTLFILVFLAANWRFATMTLINWDNRAESRQEAGNFITTRKCKRGPEQENTFVWEIRPKELPTNNRVSLLLSRPHM